MKSERNTISSKKAQGGRFRRSVLATACGLALAGGAAAQTVTYTFTSGAPSTQPALFDASVDTHASVIGSPQFNSGTGLATLGASAPITYDLLNPLSATSIANISNHLYASAGGNKVTNTSTFSSNTNGTSIDVGQIQGGSNAAFVSTVTKVNSSSVSVNLTNQGVVPITVSNNSITAGTTLNEASSTMSGSVAAGYSNATDGFGNVVMDAATKVTSTNTAGLSISNNQVAQNASQRGGSSATVNTSTVLVDVKQSGGALSQPISLESNTIQGSFIANKGASTISIDSATAPVRSAAVITNAQVNVESVAGGSAAGVDTANVNGSNVQAELRDRTGGLTSVTGAVTVNGNSIVASSTGNTAVGADPNGNVAFGNQILFGSGVDVAGAGTTNAGASSTQVGVNTLQASGAADLLIVSSQTNQGTRLVTDATTNNIRINADNTASTAAVTLNGNTISAMGTGNVAGSRIANSTNAANYTASSAAVNLQTNNVTVGGAFIDTTNSGAGVTLNVGQAGNTVSGAITANDNLVNASSAGNLANTQIAVTATNVVPAASPSAVTSTISGVGAVSDASGLAAANLQANYDATGHNIRAQLASSVVQINAADTVTKVAQNVSGNLTATGNDVASSAIGNNATTGVAVGVLTDAVDIKATNVTTTAAVANTQLNQSNLVSRNNDSGVQITGAGLAAGSNVTLNDNGVSSVAIANNGNNSLSINSVNLTTTPAGDSATASATQAGSPAGLAVTSGQVTSGSVSARTLTNTQAFVQARVGLPASTITGANVAVDKNTASAAGVGNQVSNDLSVVTNSLTSTAAGQVAGVANLQVNNSTADDVKIGRTGVITTPLVGVSYEGTVTNSNLSASDNTVQGLLLGNSATNTLSLQATSLAVAAAATGVDSITGGIGTVTAPFGMVNRQIDGAATRTATVDRVVVGIDDFTNPVAMSGDNITVSGNKILADAGNNTATNSVELTKFSTITGAASALNMQTSGAQTTATVTNGRVRIQATNTTIADSNLTLSDNKVEGAATGNFAANTLTASASNVLTGNAIIAAAAGGTAVNATNGAVGTTADFSLASTQTQSGLGINSNTEGSVRIATQGSDVTGGTLTLNGNQVNAKAQANDVSNLATLSATNVTASGGIANSQISTAPVSASQSTQAGQGATFNITADSTNGTNVTMTGNKALAQAGQNTAVNQLVVEGTTITGRGFNNVSAYVAGGISRLNADFSVINQQIGGAGSSVTAVSVPATIGTRIDSVTGGSVVVNGNSATAQAQVNNATNLLILQGKTPGTDPSSVAASAAILNSQTTSANTAVNATVGDGGTTATQVGVMTNVNPLTITNAPVTVSGNAVTASGGGNTAFNGLQVTAASALNASGGTPNFAILNYQTNAATVTSTINLAMVGINAPLGTLTGSNASVIGNQVLAEAYGNKATNTLIASTLNGNNLTSQLLNNNQSNTAAMTSTVTAATVGIIGGTSSGASSVVSGNSIGATTIGNTATNTMINR
jgi:hypothetical protein